MACSPHGYYRDQARIPSSEIGKCSTDGLDVLIGKKRTVDVDARAKELSRARLLRWILPGQMVTMDYRTDRLNLRVGPDGRITQVSCG